MFSFCLCRLVATPALLLLLSHREAKVQQNKGSIVQSQQVASQVKVQTFTLAFVRDLWSFSSMEWTKQSPQWSGNVSKWDGWMDGWTQLSPMLRAISVIRLPAILTWVNFDVFMVSKPQEAIIVASNWCLLHMAALLPLSKKDPWSIPWWYLAGFCARISSHSPKSCRCIGEWI